MEGSTVYHTEAQQMSILLNNRKDFWRRINNKLILRGVSLAGEDGKILNNLISGMTWLEGIPISLLESYKIQYTHLKNLQSPDYDAIERDIARTVRGDRGTRVFGSLSEKAKIRYSDALRNILNAASIVHDFGYCQGMNYIVDFSLKGEVSEIDSFCLLMYSFRTRNLWGLYQKDVPILPELMSRFDNLVQETVPDLAVHLEQEQFQATLYAIEWFTTLFSLSCSLELTLATWDLFFQGYRDAFIRIPLACLVYMQDMLLKLDQEQLMKQFRELAINVPTEGVIVLAFDLDLEHLESSRKFKPDTLTALTHKYDRPGSLREGVRHSLYLAKKHPDLAGAAQNVGRIFGISHLSAAWSRELSILKNNWERYCLADQLLRFAIVQNLHPRVAAFAIAAGADVNFQDLRLLTPLHVAALFDRPDIARLLLFAGSDKDLKGGAHHNQSTACAFIPLMMAKKYHISPKDKQISLPSPTKIKPPNFYKSDEQTIPNINLGELASLVLGSPPFMPEESAVELVLQGSVCLQCNRILEPRQKKQCSQCQHFFCADEVLTESTRLTADLKKKSQKHRKKCYKKHFCPEVRSRRIFNAPVWDSPGGSEDGITLEDGLLESDKNSPDLFQIEIDANSSGIVTKKKSQDKNTGILDSINSLLQVILPSQTTPQANFDSSFFSGPDATSKCEPTDVFEEPEQYYRNATKELSQPSVYNSHTGAQILIDVMQKITFHHNPQPIQWWYLALLLPGKMKEIVVTVPETSLFSSVRFTIGFNNIIPPRGLNLDPLSGKINWALVSHNIQLKERFRPRYHSDSAANGSYARQFAKDGTFDEKYLIPNEILANENYSSWCCPICFTLHYKFVFGRKTQCRGCGTFYCDFDCPETYICDLNTKVRMCKFCMEEIDCIRGRTPRVGMRRFKTLTGNACDDLRPRYSEPRLQNSSPNQTKKMSHADQNPSNDELNNLRLKISLVRSFEDISHRREL